MKYFLLCFSLLSLMSFTSATYADASAINLSCPNFNGTWQCPHPDPSTEGETLNVKVKQTKKTLKVINPDESVYIYALKEGEQKLSYKENSESPEEDVGVSYTLACTENNLTIVEAYNGTGMISDFQFTKSYTLSDDKKSVTFKLTSPSEDGENEDGTPKTEEITTVCTKK